MKNSVIKGSIFVALGASSYGMLATFVKMAYDEGFTTAEVTLSQFILGFAGLSILTMLRKKDAVTEKKPADVRSVLKLIFAGTSMGLTSIFYYMAVQYIPVSVGIVLLMQTVWMGVILEMLLNRKAPGPRKIVAVFIILAGTLLATNILTQSVSINWIGFGWGMLAAMSYTASLYASHNVVLHFPPLKRSLYLILGGLVIISLIFHKSITQSFPFEIFLRWGLLLSLFGTILPPLLFTRGVPLIGMGLGAIIASVEIPVSILMAHLLLGEAVSFLQWVGVVLILFAVVLMNFNAGTKAFINTDLPSPEQSFKHLN
jgi:drug/metabolite transporter (DMT)-like permease